MSALRFAVVLPLLLLVVQPAEAQRYRRRAMFYGSPYGGVTVSPRGVTVHTPYYSFRRTTTPAVPPAVPHGSAYRGSSAAPTPTPATSPTPATPLTEAPAYQPSLAAQPALPETEQDLAAAFAAFSVRLDSYAGGEGWQRYLTPADADLGSPAFRAKLLERMNSVAMEPRYMAVSQLQEFLALHAALQISSSQPQLSEPQPSLPPAPVEAADPHPTAEPLPTPQARPAEASAERSVLTQ